MSKLTSKEIEKVAKLARIELQDNNKEQLVNELSSILDFVDDLQSLNLEDLEPISQAVSYTHLDVYKRQSNNQLTISNSLSQGWQHAKKNYSVLILCFLVLAGISTAFSISVSYTHLDVYKRQGFRK